VRRTDAFWTRESNEYTTRNLEASREVSSAAICDILKLGGAEFKTALQIGSAGGDELAAVVERFGCTGTGIEPGAEAIAIARQRYPDLHFHQGFAQDLPFDDSSFDLVIATGVLYWVDRQHIYHAIGETLRVASKYVVVAEFAPVAPYSTPYRNAPTSETRTWKRPTRDAYLAMGHARLIAQATHFDDAGDWDRRTISLYAKVPLDEAYPLRVQPGPDGKTGPASAS